MKTSKIRILLVEDESLIRMLVAETLGEEGFEVIEAWDTAGAMQALSEASRFDILFFDIRIPGPLDGMEIAAEARAVDPSIPVIFATGFARDLARRLGTFSPPAFLLEKPYRLTEAVATIRRGLSWNSVSAKQPATPLTSLAVTRATRRLADWN